MSIDRGGFLNADHLARLLRRLVSGTIPDESRQTLPLPQRGKGKGFLAFLFCPAMATPMEGVKHLAPDYMAVIDAQTGKLEMLRAVTPADFGQKDDPERVLGIVKMPEGSTVEQQMAERDRLFAIYDVLFPAFALSEAKKSDRLKELSYEFEKLFQRLSEPALRPYYENGAKEFFAWVKHIQR